MTSEEEALWLGRYEKYISKWSGMLEQHKQLPPYLKRDTAYSMRDWSKTHDDLLALAKRAGFETLNISLVDWNGRDQLIKPPTGSGCYAALERFFALVKTKQQGQHT